MKCLPVVFLLLSTSANAAQVHHCVADAITRAKPLLKLHFEDKDTKLRFEDSKSDDDSSLPRAAIDDHVKVLAPIKALKGNEKYDVLEVWGRVYKGSYRMRFIYMQLKDECALMGQEILESAD